MKATQYNAVCNRTEHKEDHVKLRNTRTGAIGYSFSCTQAGETVQVRLENGELDSWETGDCEEIA
jgi:hypothetical protein